MERSGEARRRGGLTVANKIAPTLGALDGIVDASNYALGTSTLADVAGVPVLLRTTKSGLDLAPYPNVLR